VAGTLKRLRVDKTKEPKENNGKISRIYRESGR
jgi:hypothetical protein